MNHYEINREERHFGFLFLSAILSNPSFRKQLFSLLNSNAKLTLNHECFDVYAEIAVFRDLWNSLGSHRDYDGGTSGELHQKRFNMLKGILDAMQIDSSLVNQEDLFWTGKIGDSKLWFPGKWSHSKIEDLEVRLHREKEKPLYRCRWLCNAKPDIMIQSGTEVLFIEVKVESGMGSNERGYSQEQTQRDIINVGKEIFDWMDNGHVKRINLTHPDALSVKTHPSPVDAIQDISWDEVIDIYGKTKIPSDIGADMLERHFKHIPKPKNV